MKKTLVFAVVLIVLLILVWFGYSSIEKLEQKKEAKELTNSLRKLIHSFNAESLDPTKETVLIFFNSGCHYCQYETAEIQKNRGAFNPYQLAFISTEPQDLAKSFLSRHQLEENYLYVHPDVVTSTIMGGVPQVFIYKNGELVKHFKGEVKVEAILKVLEL